MRRIFLCVSLCVVGSVLLSFLFLREKSVHVSSAFTPPEQRDFILIETHKNRLTFFKKNKAVFVYPVAIGKWRTPTPYGVFQISHRFKSQGGGFGTRFLGLNVPWGQYGIHGTNKPSSIGQNASHGCIRMYNKDVEKLYQAVQNGTLVVIEGANVGALNGHLRTLKQGDRNNHVYLVQQKLVHLGFLYGRADGVYGENTSRAVLKARQKFGLSLVDVVDHALYQCLGIMLFE